MYPGLSDADCQVAAFHYPQLVNEGHRQQVSTDARPVSGISRSVSIAVRQQIGAILVRAGQHLQRGRAVRNESLVPTATSEMGALA